MISPGYLEKDYKKNPKDQGHITAIKLHYHRDRRPSVTREATFLNQHHGDGVYLDESNPRASVNHYKCAGLS